jgi:pimeloyl-ACP methyl ester carboxylesterase
LVTGLAVVAALASACSDGFDSGDEAATGSASAPPATGSAAVSPSLEQPNRRCGGPDTGATLVRFTASDGTGLNGVLVGSGTTGVVLVHEYPEDLCGAWPFGTYLAERGMRAFAVDLRCFGHSACPDGEARLRVIDDVAAAVAELRRRGATTIALVGSSMGGAAALIAATVVQPRVAAVVAVSTPADPSDRIGIPLNAGTAVNRLQVPTMFVVATNDPNVPVEESRAMYQSMDSTAKRLTVLSDEFDGQHGWQLLSNPAGEGFSSVAAQVAAFLTTHTRR